MGPVLVSQAPDAVAYLRTPRAIRERCGLLADRALRGLSPAFRVRRERLDAVADAVVDVIRARFPRLDAPLHGRLRHFDAGGRLRTPALEARLRSLGPLERARTKVDLVVTSVLLDAGAGPDWAYCEDGVAYTRSEGLAIASFHLFCSGALSADGRALRADAAGLEAIDRAKLGEAFQVRPGNELVGLEGRAAILSALGAALRARPDLFGADARPGGLVDWAIDNAVDGRIEAGALLGAVLEGLAEVWPGRVRLGGASLGDTWPHPALGDPAFDAASDALVPFHKLSQWLTCSLVEPLLEAGLEITGMGALTPLAEYRNGGLLLDGGVLELCDEGARKVAHPIGSPMVVEWRALTVALLDEVVPRIGDRLGLSCSSAEGANLICWGTWAAGRELAKKCRAGGGPPLPLVSDGTVF